MRTPTSSDEPASIPIGPSSDSGRQALATAVRRLMAATVSSVASSETLADATATLSGVADQLERHLPESDGVGASRYAADNAGADATSNLADVMPFDVVIGPCNPVALPLVIEFDPPKAIGNATFTSTYEGAPGCVHGAVLAGAFDLVLTAANVIAGAAGPTVTLTIRYLQPTVINRPARFEGWVTSIEGRRIHSRGQLIQAGVVTVEAVGEFATMDRSRIVSMHRRGGGGGG
jgi:acyl-coenzyme A thioesterase PaaI-like protein